MVELDEMNQFFRETEDRKIPYKNTEMVSAIENACLEGKLDLVNDFITTLSDAYVRLNPNKPRKEMLNNAYETIITLAYRVDYPAKEDFKDMLSNYLIDKKETMKMVSSVFDSRGIDLIEILKRNKYFVNSN